MGEKEGKILMEKNRINNKYRLQNIIEFLILISIRSDNTS
jgi:hypothetical protein